MTNEEIKKWCKSKKITQAQLANRSGYSAGMLAQALNGHEVFSARMQAAIARVIKEYEDPLSLEISDEKKAVLIEKAAAAQQSLEDFLRTLFAETLGIEYPPRK